MNYTRHELGAYNLHLINTDKFKTVKVEISFKKPIQKEDSTYRNLLCELMTLTTKKYKTKRQLAIKKQELYSSFIGATNHRYGNYINTIFSLNVLNDKYTEEGNFNNALMFFKDIIFDVDVEGNGFNEKNFEREKNNYKLDLDGIKEDSDSYSMIRMYEVMEKDGPSSYRLMGYPEILEDITKEDLYHHYKDMLKTSLVDVFVIGDFDNEEMLEKIRSFMSLNVFKKKRVNYVLEEKELRKRRLFGAEQADNLQSKLAYGFRFQKLSTYERNYPLTLLNIIFGGGVESKLFREVREKHSLCYYINSVCNKFDNIIMVRAGIDKANLKQTVDLVDKELTKLKKGKISDEDIAKAKEFYLTVLDAIEENPSQILSDYLMMEILETDSIVEKRKKIMEVSKNDIVKVAKKIKGDTVFCLEGDKE